MYKYKRTKRVGDTVFYPDPANQFEGVVVANFTALSNAEMCVVEARLPPFTGTIRILPADRLKRLFRQVNKND